MRITNLAYILYHQEETSVTKVCHERRQSVPAALEDTSLCYTSGNVFTRLAKELQKVTIIVVICQLRIPHGTTGLPLDGFSYNFILVTITKLCLSVKSLVKIGQKYRTLNM